jgi:hypothetical protein
MFKRFPGYDFCTGAIIILTLLSQSTEARAWSDDTFEEYLAAGKWSVTADDNQSGETLPYATVERIVRRYCEAPGNADARENVGILAIAVGAANWGVSNPEKLPPDPNKESWKSTTGADAGKHVMSYAIGGVGISHGDVGDLQDFLRRLAQKDNLPAGEKAGLMKLADGVRYRKPGVVYDEVRAAGVCSPTKFDTDLKGSAFEHLPQSAKRVYCAVRKNSALGAADWRLFRSAVRDALRSKEEQSWLLKYWLRKYWDVSLAKVAPGPGFIEEAIVNARIRNSSPVWANRAIAGASATPQQRIDRELKVYRTRDRETADRRRGTMLRPVVLYQGISADLKRAGINCP